MFAASDAARACDLEAAWCDPGVKAVLCARGGYGAARLIDLVDWARLRRQPPKWLVGSSDVTALHESLGRRLSLSTLYAPMVASEAFAGDKPDTATLAGLRLALFDGVDGLVISAEEPFCVIAGSGSATGTLVGGNLAVVAAGVGTPDSVVADGSVAFLEDVNEPPYKVDRLLTQLLRCGWFTGVRGVALGTFHGCGDVVPVLHERLARLGVPVVGTFTVGHGPVQLSLPLGVDVTVDTGSGTLTVDSRRSSSTKPAIATPMNNHH
jgi:muramoyltetrapeptide carboxypeptidase